MKTREWDKKYESRFTSWSQNQEDAEHLPVVTDLARAPYEINHPDTGAAVGTASQTLYGQRTWRDEPSSPLLITGQYADEESGRTTASATYNLKSFKIAGSLNEAGIISWAVLKSSLPNRVSKEDPVRQSMGFRWPPNSAKAGDLAVFIPRIRSAMDNFTISG